MKNIYYTADYIEEEGRYADKCSMKLIHDTSGFRVVVIISANRNLISKVSRVFCTCNDYTAKITDIKVSECISGYSDGRAYTIIIIANNVFHCYASSKDNILIFCKRGLFGIGYHIRELSKMTGIKTGGETVYFCQGEVREGYYFLVNNTIRYDSGMKKYIGRLFYTNNIFRRKRLAYKSNRELITTINNNCADSLKNYGGSVALLACNGRR